MLPKEITEKYSDYLIAKDRYNTQKARQEKLEKQLDNCKKRVNKLWNNIPHWHEFILRPLAEYLVQYYYPDRTIEIYGPFGLRNQSSIWLIKDPTLEKTNNEAFYANDNVLSLSFIPSFSEEEHIIRYETGEMKHTFKENTLGDVNGMNNVTKPLESIEELVELLRKQENAKTNTGNNN